MLMVLKSNEPFEVGSLLHYFGPVCIYPRWCRISEPSTVAVVPQLNGICILYLIYMNVLYI